MAPFDDMLSYMLKYVVGACLLARLGWVPIIADGGILLKNPVGSLSWNLQGQIIETVTAADSGSQMNGDQGLACQHFCSGLTLW